MMMLKQVAGTTGTSSLTGSKYLNTVQDQNCSFSFEQQQAKFNENETK
jgi:hypothetical protein